MRKEDKAARRLNTEKEIHHAGATPKARKEIKKRPPHYLMAQFVHNTTRYWNNMTVNERIAACLVIAAGSGIAIFTIYTLFLGSKAVPVDNQTGNFTPVPAPSNSPSASSILLSHVQRSNIFSQHYEPKNPQIKKIIQGKNKGSNQCQKVRPSFFPFLRNEKCPHFIKNHIRVLSKPRLI